MFEFNNFIYSVDIFIVHSSKNKYYVKIDYMTPENIKMEDMIEKHETLIREKNW